MDDDDSFDHADDDEVTSFIRNCRYPLPYLTVDSNYCQLKMYMYRPTQQDSVSGDPLWL